MNNKLPIIIQTVAYQIKDGTPQYLYLKRSPERGEFWNAVNGTLEMDENVLECARREMQEEANLTEFVRWSDELHRFSFDYKGSAMTVIVFAAEVPKDSKVEINEEHTEFLWADYEKALTLLKFDDDKEALKKVHGFAGESK